jgi:hypothetical protein
VFFSNLEVSGLLRSIPDLRSLSPNLLRKKLQPSKQSGKLQVVKKNPNAGTKYSEKEKIIREPATLENTEKKNRSEPEGELWYMHEKNGKNKVDQNLEIKFWKF